MPDERPRNPSGWLLLHCFVGPAIGTIVFISVPLIADFISASGTLAEWYPSDYVMIPALLLAGLLPGWFFGFIPALLHALAMLLLRPIIPSRALWLAVTPLIGWLAVFLPLLVIAGPQAPERITHSANMALVGSAAAIGCMAIAWRRGMYPVNAGGKLIPAP